MILTLIRNKNFIFPSTNAIGASFFHDEVVSASRAELFSKVIGHFDNGDTVSSISPFFLVSLASPGILKLLTKPEIEANLLRMVHTEQQLYFFNAICAGMMLKFLHRVSDISSTAAGETLTVETICKEAVSGSMVCFSKAKFLFKGNSNRSIPRRIQNDNLSEQFKQIVLKIGKKDAIRYARASGDNNPIHTNYIIARAAGFKKPVLQGMYLLGLIYTKLTELQSGLQAKPHSISCRFSGISYPGDNLDLEFATRPGQDLNLEFNVINSNGKKVIKEGHFESFSLHDRKFETKDT